MKNDKSKSRCDRVFTGADWVLEADRISRIITLLPEGGELTIGRGENGWKIECHTETGRIIRIETWNPGEYLEYIENLLGKLKRLEGNKSHEKRDTWRDQAIGAGSIPAQGQDNGQIEVLQAKEEGGRTQRTNEYDSTGKVSPHHQHGISGP